VEAASDRSGAIHVSNGPPTARRARVIAACGRDPRCSAVACPWAASLWTRSGGVVDAVGCRRRQAGPRRGRAVLSAGNVEVGREALELEAEGLELEPHRVRPPGGESQWAELSTAPPAELGPERVSRILEHPVQHMSRTDPLVPAVAGVPGRERSGARRRQCVARSR
jgi:hypothetical protein